VTQILSQNAGPQNVKLALPSGIVPFLPRRGLSNGHIQTIVGNFLPRPALHLPVSAETVEVDPADGSRVLCHCHWQPEPADHLTLLLVHGLEGSSDSRYIQGITARAWVAGFTGRFNLKRFGLVGYSMGGNLVLKLAGEWGSRQPLCAVAAVCPAINLAAGSDALHAPANRLYEWKFLRGLMARFHRKAELFPAIYNTKGLGTISSIRQFDDKILARYWNFRDADEYYDRAASANVVDRIVVPTLILSAQDDPFIRLLPETRAKLLANPSINLVESRHGGHCAFLSRDAGDEIHWAEAAVIRYLMSVAG